MESPVINAQTLPRIDRNQLCEECAKIHITEWMQTPAEEFPNEGVQVAWWPCSAEEMKKRDCAWCPMFASICGSDGRPTQQLRAFTTLPLGPTQYSMFRLKDETTPVFFAMLRGDEISKHSMHIHEMCQRGLLVPQPVDKRIVKRVTGKLQSVDFELFRSWIDSCRCGHPPCHKRTGLEPHLDSLKVIDCKNFSFADICPNSDDYLTLSYAWGENGREIFYAKSENETDAHDLHSAPKTIKDAMAAVKSLGFHYLWVDQYCIDQRSESEKKLMMDKMSLIYGYSLATIIAAYGQNCYDGLPGVTDVKRSPQLCVSYNGVELCTTLPSVAEAISNSKWNTRAWTYPEARLSERLLIFSEHQVYYVCNSDCRSEAIQSTSSSVFNALNNFDIAPALFEDGKVAGSNIWLDRFAYSKRFLSEAKDGLDAFRGILARSKWITFWGVTIAIVDSCSDCYDGFAMGLLWCRAIPNDIGENFQSTPKSTLTGKRAGFPTWAWPSSNEQIFFNTGPPGSTLWSYMKEMGHDSLQNFSKLRIWIANDAGNWEPLHTRVATQKSNIIKEISPCLFIEGDLVKVWRKEQEPKKAKGRKKTRGVREDKQLWFFEGLPEPVSTAWRPDHLLEEDWTLNPHNALVLVNWDDHDQTSSKRKFVLMVLDEVGDNEFKRVGILSRYKEDWNEDHVSKIAQKMRRVKFTLI